MRVSAAGLELISRFEGLRLTAYTDPVGILTIGFGHTGADVRPGLTITRPRALELLREDTSGAEAQVAQLVTKPLNQSQFDALVSLVFNAGGAPLHGTLGRKLNAGDFPGACDEFGKWVKGTIDGRLVTLAGLVRRRAAEAEMFRGSPTVHDPSGVLNRNERDWVARYDALVEAGDGNSPEATELQERMRVQRKTIWRLAQPKEQGGDGKGWNFRHRVERYRVLKARTTQ
jgi:GH24 family phage-related lysozyme (muramidase)